MTRFVVGQIWECRFDGILRQLRVEQVFDDGRKGVLRFLDNNELVGQPLLRAELGTNWRLLSEPSRQK
jgi:hypothetical protein